MEDRTATRGYRRQQGAERREQILDAAVRVFARKGFSGASIRDIAREVGVTEGLLYHYFPSKEDLLKACWQERSWHEHLQRILAAATDRPLIDVMRDICRQFLVTLYENREMVRMCEAEMQYHPELAEYHRNKVEDVRAMLTSFLLKRQSAGDIRRNCRVEGIVYLMMGASYGLFQRFGSVEAEMWWRLVDDFVDAAVDIVAHGALSAV